ncbi:hypothetical protein D3C86_1586430 [compost metagenome]
MFGDSDCEIDVFGGEAEVIAHVQCSDDIAGGGVFASWDARYFDTDVQEHLAQVQTITVGNCRTSDLAGDAIDGLRDPGRIGHAVLHFGFAFRIGRRRDCAKRKFASGKLKTLRTHGFVKGFEQYALPRLISDTHRLCPRLEM